YWLNEHASAHDHDHQWTRRLAGFTLAVYRRSNRGVKRRIENESKEEEQQEKNPGRQTDVRQREGHRRRSELRHNRRSELEQNVSRPDPEYLLRQSDRPDAEDLTDEQSVGWNAGHHDFGDARRLLLEHAAHDRLPINHDRQVQKEPDREAEQHARHPRSRSAALGDPLGAEVERNEGDLLHLLVVEPDLFQSGREYCLPDRAFYLRHVGNRGRIRSAIAR